MILLTVCFLFALSLESPAVTNSTRPYPDQARITSLYDSLTHPVIDEQKAAIIKDLSFVRGGQRMVFTEGTIHFFVPVNHSIFVAVFSGSATFTATPPTEIERNEFERQTGIKLEQNSHTYTFQRAVLWFTDSIFEEMQPHLQFQKIEIQHTDQKAVNRSLEYATHYYNENNIYRIMQEMHEISPEHSPHSDEYWVKCDTVKRYSSYCQKSSDS